MNTYAYVGGNPVNYADPFGLFMSSCGPGHIYCAAILGGVVGANTRVAQAPTHAGDIQDISAGERLGLMCVGMVGVPVLNATYSGVKGLANELLSRATGGISDWINPKKWINRFKNKRKIGAPKPNIPSLRQQYVDEVSGLATQAESMRKAGASSESIAKTLHARRRALGVKYKTLTPPDKLEQIYQRNIEKYGDKLGPTFDYLRRRGKTFEDIINTPLKTRIISIKS